MKSREVLLWVLSPVIPGTDFSHQVKAVLMGIFKNQEIFYMPFQQKVAFRTWSDRNLANHLQEASQFDSKCDRKQNYQKGEDLTCD